MRIIPNGPIKAPYWGICYNCLKDIQAGDQIYTSNLPFGKIVAFHEECAKKIIITTSSLTGEDVQNKG